MSVAAATTNTTTGSSSSGMVSSNNMGSTSMFLKLLIAQMKNQDPTSPQDPTQMVTQLAQFNTLQQQISSTQYLKQIASAQNGNSNTASYLGHTAVVNSSNFSFDGSTAQQILANMSGAAANASVQVVDSTTGKVVATLNTGSLPAGTSSFTWNGAMDGGGTAPAGSYSIQINATDATGQPVSSTAATMGTVSAVDMSSSGTELVVAGSPTPLSSISQIRM